MDIQVGDRITYKYDVMEVETIEVIYDLARISTLLFEIEKGNMKILKIERPKYEVVEEKKELLTEEEKEFLKDIIKYYDKATGIEFRDEFISIIKDSDYSLVNLDYPNNMKFINVKKYTKYKLKELGLEEN